MAQPSLLVQREIATLEKAAADEAKKAAEKQAEVERKAGDIRGNLEEMRERAGGRDRKADKIARERKISTRAAAIADETGMDMANATNLAAEESDLQDKISGKRRGVRRSRNTRPKTIFDTGFNEFFYPEQTEFGKKSAKDFGEQSFDEFFGNKDIVPPKNFAPRNTVNGTKTNTKDPSANDSRRLLERIAAGIEKITAE